MLATPGNFSANLSHMLAKKSAMPEVERADKLAAALRIYGVYTEESTGEEVEYTAPSESQFAASVAKDMAGEIASSRRTWIGIAVVVVIIIIAVIWFSQGGG